MSESTITFVILGVAVVLFVWNRLPVEVVALGVALSLWATDVLTIEQAVSGFGETTILFIASLFVVSEALDSTGVTAWAGQQLIARAGTSQTRLLVFTMLLVALLTAVISVNGAVAALVPMVVVIAVRLGRVPSKLMMPLAFGAHAGSMLALTGTPVSVIVSDAAHDAGAGRFGFFEFTLVGVPLVAGVILITVVLGNRLLPDRTAEVIPPDLSQFARTLAEQYEIDHSMARLVVDASSPLVGVARGALDREWDERTTLTGVQRAGRGGLGTDDPVAAGDVLVVSGRPEFVEALHEPLGVRTAPTTVDQPDDQSLLNREIGVAEFIVPPRSEFIGRRVFPGMVFGGSKVVVLAVQRNGEHTRGEVTLAAGDTMLVQGTWQALEQSPPPMLVVDDPAMVRRQAVPLGLGAKQALAVVAAMVVLLATGLVPAVVAGLLAAGALVLLNVVPLPQAYRSISWTTIVLVGGMTPLSAAMQQTGAAQKLADGLIDLVGDAGPYALVAGLFVLTAVLGQLISNMATALIVIPIAVTAAAELDVSASPVLMAVNIAAAAAFITPVATPANLMVMGPGGYKFGDYWKLGSCMLVFFGLVAVFYVPLIWSF
ncbi:MAG: SLC13 family permease [Actinobacteria bacterium]|nr:SLC13 family permease [Actinomycetota bacterium]